MDTSLDELLRTYSTLWAIRSNLVGHEMISRELGKQYDSLIDRVSQAMKNDLTEFKIGDAYLSANQKYQDANMMRIRLDSVLGYMRTHMPREQIELIGFRTEGASS
jgi:hypothetical protein